MRLHRSRDEEGAVAVLAGLAFLMLFTLAAMVVQFGFTRDVRSQSQNASDASALAAAYVVSNATSSPDLTAAVNTAITYAQVNFQVDPADWGTTKCSDSSPLAFKTTITNCVSFDSGTAPTKVRVVMPARETVTGVGKGVGANSIPIGSVAEASIAAPKVVTCGLCVLGSVSTNNSDFTVTAGSIAVNGNITSNSQSYWKADGKIQVAGTVNGVDPNSVNDPKFTPTPTKTATFADPYASMAMPTVGTLTNLSSTTSCNGSLSPGVYAGMSIGSCTLSPGLYIITGLWSEGNNSVLSGTGVTLYFTCGSPGAVRPCNTTDTAGTGGRLDAKNGDVPLTSGAPGYANLAIMYDRLNPNTLELQGNGGTEITGAIYAVNADVNFNGNSTFGVSGGPVVVKGVSGVGNTSGLSVLNSKDVTVSSTPGKSNLSK